MVEFSRYEMMKFHIGAYNGDRAYHWIGLALGQTVRARGGAGLLPGVIVCNFLQKKKMFVSMCAQQTFPV